MTVHRATLVLAVVLVASVIANVVFASRRTSRTHDASRVTRSSAIMPPVTWSSAPECEREREAIETKLTKIETEIEARLTLDDKYERGIPSPKNEARIRALFVKTFGDECTDEICVVNCRGAICKIEVDLGAKETPHDFVSRFNDATMGMLESVGQRHRNTRDAITGRRVQLAEITAELVGEPEALGRQLLVEITEAFLAAPAIEACKKQHPEPGYVVFHLDIDTQRSAIVVQQAGPLAGKPIAACLRATLDGIVATHPVPPNALAIPNFYFPVVVP